MCIRDRKKLFIFFVGVQFIFLSNINAQKVNYEIIHNDPSVGLSNAQLRLTTGLDLNSLTWIYLNIGLAGEASIKNRLGVDLNIDYSYFNIADISIDKTSVSTGTYTYELGGFYFFSDKTKVGNQKVVLDTKTVYGRNSYSQTGTLTTYITVPNTNLRYLTGVRGGLYLYGAIADSRNYVDKISGPYAGIDNWTHYNATGIYVGLVRKKIAALLIKTDNYGTCGSRGYSNKYYGDVLIAPIISASSYMKGSDIDMSGVISKSPIGFRVGMENSPCSDKGKGASIKFEVGYRPGIGAWYCSLTFGLKLLNRQIGKLDSFAK